MAYSPDKLKGKDILVIGGTSGIGLGAAEAFLAVGAKVTVISSSQSNVDAAVKQLNSPSVAGRVGDVRQETAFVDLLKELGPVDHVVFSGVDKIIRGNLEDLSLDDAKYLFGVKFWGAVLVARAVAKYDIIRPGGSLTLTSGTAGIKPGKNAAVGAGLNGGVLSLTKGLASDLAAKKIRVNTVVPGLVLTPLWDKLGKTKDEQAQLVQDFEGKLPVGFVATPQDIAEAYVYAVRANYATGTLIVIDGGGIL